jgi:soluble lytic murein transglycosylase
MNKLLSAVTVVAVSFWELTAAAQTKPPPKPGPAAKAVAAKPAAGRPHPTIQRRPVFVPPPPVIEVDEQALPADLPATLEADSVARYRRIFAAQSSGSWQQADAEIGPLKDKTLMGYVGAQRLLSTGHNSSFDQLAAWLQDYNDHPDAPAIYRLALTRRPKGGPEVTPASFSVQPRYSPTFAAARTVSGADAARATETRTRLQQMLDDGGFNAAFALLDRRETGDLLGPQEVEMWRGRVRTRALEADSQGGLQLPIEVSGPPDANWTAAIGAFTRGQYSEAARRFELVADAPPDQASSWTLAAGAFWAARANLLAGNPQKYVPYLKRAALYERTFHGLIAQRALGMRIVPDAALPRVDRGVAKILQQDRASNRALALLQLGAVTAAERELYAASVDADPGLIQAILALAQKAVLPGLSVRVANAAWDQRHNIAGYDAAMYPFPPWQPPEGFVVDRALVWGFMRQESAFNPKARSYVGAMGLMQLMPATARIVTNKYLPDRVGQNPYDPGFNTSLGQQYINSLIGDIDDSLVRTAAAYNGGPGNVARWDKSLGASHDPLLYVALIPLNETRDFVQRVLANYWIYQLRLGQPTPSLDQIAAHEWPKYVAQDGRR